MTPTDRAIRVACQGIVLLWIVAFLGWRDLAPREVRVPIEAAAIEMHEAPPAPDEPEPPAEIEAAQQEPPEPEPAEPEPAEPEQFAEAPPPASEIAPEVAPEPQAPEIAEAIPEPPPPAPPEVAPPAPAPAPAPALADASPAPPAAREAPPVPLLAVEEADVAHGGALLTGAAGFPMLESRYERYGSFREYAGAMRRLGAEFVVVNRREIVGTIDPWTLETGALANPAALSPRARDYAGEPELVRASRAVRSAHGRRAEVMMLVPRRLDAGLFGGIARALEARGDDPGAYRQIRAHYERGPAGGLRLRVEAAVRRDGREEPLPLLFDLDRLVDRSRA